MRKSEIQVVLEDRIVKLHESYFVSGDYARLSEITGMTKATVSACIQKKTAPLSLAKAIKEYYLQKEKIAEELNA